VQGLRAVPTSYFPTSTNKAAMKHLERVTKDYPCTTLRRLRMLRPFNCYANAATNHNRTPHTNSDRLD